MLLVYPPAIGNFVSFLNTLTLSVQPSTVLNFRRYLEA